MNIYQFSRKAGYDEYDGAVVLAETQLEAEAIVAALLKDYMGVPPIWESIVVVDASRPQLILSSFNAG